jgi:hypothetical protein
MDKMALRVPPSSFFFETCCNIQYLGLNFSEDYLDPSKFISETNPYGFLPRIEVLRTLQQPRVIHLRHPWDTESEEDIVGDYKTTSHITWEMQRFCNRFFYYMEKQRACPSLRAIKLVSDSKLSHTMSSERPTKATTHATVSSRAIKRIFLIARRLLRCQYRRTEHANWNRNATCWTLIRRLYNLSFWQQSSA